MIAIDRDREDRDEGGRSCLQQSFCNTFFHNSLDFPSKRETEREGNPDLTGG